MPPSFLTSKEHFCTCVAGEVSLTLRMRNMWSFIACYYASSRGSLVAQRESVCSAGDPGSTSGSRRSPGEGNGYSLQYCCLENPRDRGAWWAAVYGVAQSWTWLRGLNSSSNVPFRMQDIFFFNFKYFFLFWDKPINNVVVVSGEQWRDSARHTHVSILSPNPLPSRLHTALSGAPCTTQ